MPKEKDLSDNTDQAKLSIDTDSDLGSPYLYYPPTNTPPAEVRLIDSPDPCFRSSSIPPTSPGFRLTDEEAATNSRRPLTSENLIMHHGMSLCGNMFKPINPPRHNSMANLPPYRSYLLSLKLNDDKSTQTDEALNLIRHIPGGLMIGEVTYILKPPSPHQNTTGTQTDQSVKPTLDVVSQEGNAPDIEPVTNFTTEKVPSPKYVSAFEALKISEPKTASCIKKDKILELKVSIPSEVEQTSDSTVTKDLKIEGVSEAKPSAAQVEKPPVSKYELPPELLIYKQDTTPPKTFNPSIDITMPFNVRLSGEDSSDDENEFMDI